uniref:Uncharacterized protein n=1 Tax=Pseudictyota dubia TaxID=2749911 RepID=A0A7R9W0W0_9STRA|eukprot:CAMPEP_0197438506 /NCGR_PEP_ID=MMETSP1175-20131217/5491_1 /TAXON_ID=1003142 /ORGANISM="Triceratium dubium, Strain CCMP147" /LENGTH=219 /DNA_ID=CAMNT_0042968255 /DNA_START=38 /DNA_END=697 /DNA_ORIENTATION=+
MASIAVHSVRLAVLRSGRISAAASLVRFKLTKHHNGRDQNEAPRASDLSLPWRRAFSAGDSGGRSGTSSSSSPSGDSGSAPAKPPSEAYVHPLSQIVLAHLQTSRSDFLMEYGLDSRLTLNPDGTFVLRFPPRSSGGSGDGDTEGYGAEEKGREDGGRIWTSYEPQEKKHWLTVHRGDLVGRYLLQDNLKPAWHSDKRSTPEKVQDAVDEMIRKLEGSG